MALNDLAGIRTLDVPKAGQAHYERNLIATVVCELRFPTLFELDSDRPPAALAKALRKVFPSYERVENVNVGPAGLVHAKLHTFRSRKRTWSVSLGTSTVTLETSAYDSFSDFASRLRTVVDSAAEVIDSDFFTRVGLRYINHVPFGTERLDQWVNPALVAPLAEGVYGTVQEIGQRVVGSTTEGGYIFQHGVVPLNAPSDSKYYLDIDLFKEDVAISDVGAVVERLHGIEYSMFYWAIGDKARQYLGPSTLG
jgi:uncharacterized protein (TIGR04255 family)